MALLNIEVPMPKRGKGGIYICPLCHSPLEEVDEDFDDGYNHDPYDDIFHRSWECHDCGYEYISE